MKIIAAALLFALVVPALAGSVDEARQHELRQKYGIDIDSALNPRSNSQARLNALLTRALAAQPRRPRRSLSEEMDRIYGPDRHNRHSHRPASGIYIDGGSYVIGPDFWCTKAGNVVVCN